MAEFEVLYKAHLPGIQPKWILSWQYYRGLQIVIFTVDYLSSCMLSGGKDGMVTFSQLAILFLWCLFLGVVVYCWCSVN